jgi:Ca-activated chloride channel family protein
LVTDGVSLNDTLSTAESLGRYDLSVFGIGTEAGAPINLTNGGFLKNAHGSIVLPRLETDNLQQLANAGGGRYQAITTDNHDIENLLSTIANSDEIMGDQNNDLLLDLWQERGPWLLFLVLPLAASLFRRGLFCLALIILLPIPEPAYAFEWKDLWQTQNQQAQQAYQQQEYEQAAEQFSDSAWKAAAQYKSGQFDKAVGSLQDIDSAESAYNLGNALAKSGKLPDAIKAYNHSLTLNPDNEDAKYNRELVENLLQKQQQNSEQNEPDQNQQQKGGNKDKTEQTENQQQNSASNPQDSDQDENSQHNNEQQESAAKQQDQNTAAKAQQEADSEQSAKQEAEPQQTSADDNAEMQQANEQWLKRIPDDPAGLLRRKFKYQYGKREQKTRSKNQW